MSKNKLEQVLEYLVNGNEDRAKELLHQVFIEKARAIHEELISDDEEFDEDTLGGDEGEQLRHELMRHDDHIDDLSDEIDAEEIMGEAEDDMIDDLGDAEMDMDDAEMDMDDAEMDLDDAGMDMDNADMDMGSDDSDILGNIDDTMGDLESALEQLKAEFEKLEGSDEEEDLGSEEDFEQGEEDFEQGEEDFEQGEEEEEMDEMFTEEDFDDLAEAIELEKVSIPTSGEVGAGKFSPRDANERSRSPVPPSQTQRFGAEPIKTGKGPTASGYSMETPPASQKTKILPKDNRRKTEFSDTENEQSGTYGAKEDSRSALDTTERTFGKGNQTSPLTRAPRK